MDICCVLTPPFTPPFTPSRSFCVCAGKAGEHTVTVYAHTVAHMREVTWAQIKGKGGAFLVVLDMPRGKTN